MQQQMDAYDVASACETMRGFLDVLTNWYVRRSRERFWDTGGADREATTQAFDTLYTCLEVVTRTCAPLLPLVTEEIWRGLTGGRSVHLADWPDATQLPSDHELVARMDRARDICSVASSLRKAQNLRVRLPLADLTVVTEDAAGLAAFADIVKDEVNVRAVTLRDVGEVSEEDFGISQRLTVNARAAGPRLGKDVQRAIKGSKSGDWSVVADGVVTAGGLELHEGEFTLETVSAGDGPDHHATAMLPGGGFVVLDTEVTPELAREGVARDLVRAVQQARRDAGFEVSDRISLTVTGAQEVYDATVHHQDLLVEETLASQFGSAPNLLAIDGDGVTEVEVGDGYHARILVKRLP
jgi:isoleucyl-tRNA synthetase